MVCRIALRIVLVIVGYLAGLLAGSAALPGILFIISNIFPDSKLFALLGLGPVGVGVADAVQQVEDGEAAGAVVAVGEQDVGVQDLGPLAVEHGGLDVDEPAGRVDRDEALLGVGGRGQRERGEGGDQDEAADGKRLRVRGRIRRRLHLDGA